MNSDAFTNLLLIGNGIVLRLLIIDSLGH